MFARNGNYYPVTGITSVKDIMALKYIKITGSRKNYLARVYNLISKILSDNGARTPAFGPSSQLVVENRKECCC